MIIVEGTLTSTELDGIDMWEKPVGTKYIVDLSMKTTLLWTNFSTGHKREIEAVPDIINGGYIPLELLEFK